MGRNISNSANGKKESSKSTPASNSTAKKVDTEDEPATEDSTSNDSIKTTLKDPSTIYVVTWSIITLVCLQLLYQACSEAYDIRMYAIREYGRVIHEFDPYFNYRATEYLYQHGWKAFSQWFDYMSWYPLGRPVGTTIYPGMQVTSVWIKNHLLPTWSINDICCFVPTWFGVTATLAVAFLTYVCTSANNYRCFLNTIPLLSQVYQLVCQPVIGLALYWSRKLLGTTFGLGVYYRPATSANKTAPAATTILTPWTSSLCAAAAAGIMSIVPAHLLRSVGGGYDNESIAMTAMVLTFACWCKALDDNVPQYVTVVWGVVTGLAYFYMVAAWGGFTFVLNLVGVHASYLVFTGNYSTKLHRAYSSFFVVGTVLAIQVPVVGLSPLKSLEQLGPFVAFAGMQLIEICEVIKRQHEKKNDRPMTFVQIWKLRFRVFAVAGVAGLAIVFLLLPTGYFGPLSSRVRGLFVKHTKTGNPLVDSVAEHQAANPSAYFQYLNQVVYIAPVGLAMTMLAFTNDASSFLLVYAVAAYYFSHRMVRLILLTAPIASALGGIAIGRIVAWGVSGIVPVEETSEPADDPQNASKSSKIKRKKGRKGSGTRNTPDEDELGWGTYSEVWWSRVARVVIVAFALKESIPYVKKFHAMAHELAGHLSHPTIIQKAQTRDGQMVMIDDYRDAYFWLKDNTPEDARIMAWWDYGYQITGISNRTTIADGNTWNHEHIAFLGRTLTAPEKEAHRIARHLADYVLVWAGGGGDDLAKSPHLRRIANSVYRGLCSEPTCQEFGFYSDRTPTPQMEESLLYKLCLGGLRGDVQVDKNRFKEYYRSKYGKVRIYKIMSVSNESKEWVANPANRVCDAPGSWFCRGQYPPALEKILKEKKDFRQLEDFNAKREDDSDYQREYFDNLLNRKTQTAPKKQMAAPAPTTLELKTQDLNNFKNEIDDEDIDIINENWENTPLTTMMWELIAENNFEEFYKIIQENPSLVHVRSEDGRGPMWWAHEYGRGKMVQIMKQLKVREDRTDEKGMTPLDVSKLKK
ncbi:hypothetical protein ACA910_011317 [Epithemia clementina (nom. ined.)]